MKKIAFFFLAGAILVGFSYDDILPNGWHKTGDNPGAFKIGVDYVKPQHGKKCAFIESVDEQPLGFCTLIQSVTNTEYINKRVKMSGYVRTEGVTDTALLWVRIDELDNIISGEFDNMNNRPIAGVTDWKKYEIIFDVPASKCRINYGMLLKGSGKAWIDNVSFDIVDKSVQKTTHRLDHSLPQSYVERQAPEKTSNLDFED